MKRKKVQLIAVIVIALVLVGGASVWGFSGYYASLLQPVSTTDHAVVLVKIPEGASVKAVSALLAKEGLIRQAWAFELYARWHHLNQYRAGTYYFNRAQSVSQLVASLKSGKFRSVVRVIDIQPGMWVKDMVPQLAAMTGLSQADVQKDLTDRDYIRTHIMSRYSFLTNDVLADGIKYPLEGYLAPGTYTFTKEKKALTLDQILDAMLAHTARELKPLASALQSNRLGSLHHVLTMASLVEGEAFASKDQRMIAGVFYNRLAKNMRLQTDPSVAYGTQKEVKNYSQKAFRADYKQDTPYNTYVHNGLPIGPICNPSAQAIAAVLNPTASDDLFFYARPNGHIYYSKTYAEHQQIVEKYEHEWSNQ
ncbi:MAG: endolytic transglycosylase MltG [Sporolactobacillus sp.]